MLYRLVGVKLEEMDQVGVQAAPVAVAHLQNALQHLHHFDAPDRPLLQTQSWEDLASYTAMMEEQKIFLASSNPTTLKDCNTLVRLAMGAKATDFAQNKRKTKAKNPNRVKPRQMEAEFPMMRAIMKNYTSHRDNTGVFRLGILSGNVMNAMVRVLHYRRGWGRTLEDTKTLIESWSFENFLMMFRLLLQLELGSCLFDYSNFSTTCHQLLNDMCFKLDKGFELQGKPSILPMQSYHYPVYLFTDEENALIRARKDIVTTQVVSPHWHYAADQFAKYAEWNETMETLGNKFTVKLINWSQ
jgi:hypothetical protein